MAGKPVVQIFFNPVCGHFSARRLRALTKAMEHKGAGVILTSIIASRSSVDPEATHVCVAGGDGTVREVGSLLARNRSQLPVAIFPLGTVNLLAREGHADSSARGCARALLSGESVRPHYPVSMGGTMFFVCATAGPDSLAVARHSPGLKRRFGRLSYVVSFARLLWSWPRPRMQVSANGNTFDCEALYIAKGRYFAGSWSFAPAASVSDKLLHVMTLRTARRWDFIRLALAMLAGRDLANVKGTTSFTCTRLHAECDGDIPVQADGDVVAGFPIDVEIVDAPVNFR